MRSRDVCCSCGAWDASRAVRVARLDYRIPVRSGMRGQPSHRQAARAAPSDVATAQSSAQAKDTVDASVPAPAPTAQRRRRRAPLAELSREEVAWRDMPHRSRSKAHKPRRASIEDVCAGIENLSVTEDGPLRTTQSPDEIDTAAERQTAPAACERPRTPSPDACVPDDSPSQVDKLLGEAVRTRPVSYPAPRRSARRATPLTVFEDPAAVHGTDTRRGMLTRARTAALTHVDKENRRYPM